MRELNSRDGDRHHAPDMSADISVKRAHESPKYEVLRDPEVRTAKHLEYQKLVEARYASEQLKPEPTRPEHTPAESRDGAAHKIGGRRESLRTRGRSAGRPSARGCRPTRRHSWWPASASRPPLSPMP